MPKVSQVIPPQAGLKLKEGNSYTIKFNGTQIYADNCRNKKDAMRIAPSAKRLSVYIRVQKEISYTIKLLANKNKSFADGSHDRRGNNGF